MFVVFFHVKFMVATRASNFQIILAGTRYLLPNATMRPLISDPGAH